MNCSESWHVTFIGLENTNPGWSEDHPGLVFDDTKPS